MVLTAVDADDAQRQALEFQLLIAGPVTIERDAIAARHALDDFRESPDMQEVARAQRPLTRGIGDTPFTAAGSLLRGLFAVIVLRILALLVTFLIAAFELGDIHQQAAMTGIQTGDDVLDKDRFGTHVADDAQTVDTLGLAAIDQHPRATLATEVVIQQLRVDQPDEERADTGNRRDGFRVIRNPLHHADLPCQRCLVHPFLGTATGDCEH